MQVDNGTLALVVSAAWPVAQALLAHFTKVKEQTRQEIDDRVEQAVKVAEREEAEILRLTARLKEAEDTNEELRMYNHELIMAMTAVQMTIPDPPSIRRMRN